MSGYKSKNPVRIRKERIRNRDRHKYQKRLVCTVCGEICRTQIHHFFYSDVYDPRAMIEVCPGCHKVLDAIHKRR